jgi:ABC-type dipeptide/oligopeptide/nickel transport system permease subunit
MAIEAERAEATGTGAGNRVALAAAAARQSAVPRSNAYYALRRFLRQKLAVLGLVISLVLIGAAVFAPWVAPTHYTDAVLLDNYQSPSRDHWFGTDSVGHDYLSRVIYGIRTSLIVAFMAVGVACAIGIPLGLVAGLRGGRVDFFVMRVVEVISA